MLSKGTSEVGRPRRQTTVAHYRAQTKVCATFGQTFSRGKASGLLWSPLQIRSRL